MKAWETAYQSGGRAVEAYVASPERPSLGVILVHEIWGLNENMRDIARRLAAEGALVLAPNLYTGHPHLTPENVERVMYRVWSLPPERRADPEAYRELAASMDEAGRRVLEDLVLNRSRLEAQMLNDLKGAYDRLAAEGVPKVVAMGFCMGGGLAFQLATEVHLDGTVVFYGRNPQPIDAVEKIRGPVLGLYALEDPPIVSGLPELVAAFVKYRKDLELKLYPGAYHAFFNDRGRTYNREAAEDAWERVKGFIRRVTG